MNFHPDKQSFQVAGAEDRTNDPWITKPLPLQHGGPTGRIFLTLFFDKCFEDFIDNEYF